jgi:hypothetical protein
MMEKQAKKIINKEPDLNLHLKNKLSNNNNPKKKKKFSSKKKMFKKLT